MAESSIKIEGLDKALRKCEAIGRLDIVKNGLLAGGKHIKGKLAQYPPATGANAPKGPGGRWYVRGQGGFYNSVNRGIIKTSSSEDLGQKWTIKSRKGGKEVIVGNNVSYGIYVQGPDDQASWMKDIGWKDTDEIAEKESDKVNKLVAQEINRALEKA